jgi:NADH dehydrogenase
VILVEAGPRVLPAFPEDLSNHAVRDLEALGVEVRLGQAVTDIGADYVQIGDDRVSACTVFWAAGNEASPLGRLTGAELDRSGRIMVQPDLSLPGHSEVFAIGDLAHVTSRGKIVPAVAPAAMQEGRHAADGIVRTVRRQDRRPFRYVNKGDLATIGRHRAVADFGRFRIAGRLAWWLWLTIHIMYLIGFRNRITVLIEWAYAYFTYQRGVRLITEPARPG